jgi:hypothetical protein
MHLFISIQKQPAGILQSLVNCMVCNNSQSDLDVPPSGTLQWFKNFFLFDFGVFIPDFSGPSFSLSVSDKCAQVLTIAVLIVPHIIFFNEIFFDSPAELREVFWSDEITKMIFVWFYS